MADNGQHHSCTTFCHSKRCEPAPPGRVKSQLYCVPGWYRAGGQANVNDADRCPASGHACLFICIRRLLETDKPKLSHKLSCQVSAHFDDLCACYRRNATRACRTIAGIKQLAHFTKSDNLFWPNRFELFPILKAAAMDFKHTAQLRHDITLLELSNYRELFSESDIKRAVAFFRISFPDLTASSASLIRGF